MEEPDTPSNLATLLSFTSSEGPFSIVVHVPPSENWNLESVLE